MPHKRHEKKDVMVAEEVVVVEEEEEGNEEEENVPSHQLSTLLQLLICAKTPLWRQHNRRLQLITIRPSFSNCFILI